MDKKWMIIGILALIMIVGTPKKEGLMNIYGYTSLSDCQNRLESFDDEQCILSCRQITQEMKDCMISNGVSNVNQVVVGRYNAYEGSPDEAECNQLTGEQLTIYQCLTGAGTCNTASCNAQDGWYCRDEYNEEEVYRDYSCSGGACVSSESQFAECYSTYGPGSVCNSLTGRCTETTCGDGTCGDQETYTNCPEDCTAPGPKGIGEECLDHDECEGNLFCVKDNTLNKKFCVDIENPSDSCEDSDGGHDYNVAGNVYLSTALRYYDYCFSSSELWEYYCSENDARVDKHSCSNGCENGVCKAGGTTPSTCSSDSQCNANSCQVCSGGKCKSKCIALIQSCDSGDCKTSIFVFILGGAFLLIIVGKAINTKK
jgi:hypothetical protein